MDSYITRLCWNEHRWERPSGSAVKLERGTFNAEFGFGFEEWLFSSSVPIDGWRYRFVQGVNKSQKRLAGKDINLFFFTIDANKDRFLVGEIQQCQVLTLDQANAAHERLESDGMITQMTNEVLAVGGNAEVLTNKSKFVKWTLDIVNMRYQPHHLIQYTKPVMAPPDSTV